MSSPPAVPDNILDRLHGRGLSIEDIDQKCADNETIVANIAAEFSAWRDTAPYLSIKRAEIKEIERDSVNERERKLQALYMWIRKKGDEATYANLIIALDNAENMELIDMILDLLLKEKQKRANKAETIKETDVKFYCGCGQCSFDDYVANRCPLPWRSPSYPMLNITDLPVPRKIELLAQLQHDYEDVKDKFAYLVSCVILIEFRHKYGDGINTVRRLTVFILAKQPFLFLDDVSKRRVRFDLQESQTVSEVFEVLTSNFVSWFNHLLFGSITKAFGVAKQQYREYVDLTLAPFLQRSLFQIPKDSFSLDNPEGSGVFVLKLEVTSPKEELRGSILLPLRRHVARKLGITIDSFRVCSYDSGCFKLVVWGPCQLLDAVFPLSRERLSELGSIPVSCRGLKLTSVEHKNNKQIPPIGRGTQTKFLDDLHDTDMHSTPLSSVEYLYSCLLLKVLELDESSLVQILRRIQTHKLSHCNNMALLTGITSRLTNDTIQYIISYMSFFNYTMLEIILKREHDSDLREYITQLENLKITDLPPLLHHTNVIVNFGKDLIVFEYQSDVKSVEDLCCIRHTFCNLYQLEQHSMIACSIDRLKCELGFLMVAEGLKYVDSLPLCNTVFRVRLKESKVVRVSYQGNILLDLTNIEDDSGMSSGIVSEDESPVRPPTINPRQQPMATPPPIESPKIALESSKLDPKEENKPQHVITDAFMKEKTEEKSEVMSNDYSSLGSLYDESHGGQSDRSSSFGQPPLIQPDSQGYFDLYMEQVMNACHLYNNYPFPPPGSFYQEPANNPIEAPFVSPESHLVEEWPDVHQEHDKPPPIQLPSSTGSVHSSAAIHLTKFKQGPFKVCKPCLSLNYSSEDLANHYCMKPFAHEDKPGTLVEWDQVTHRLKEVAPMTSSTDSMNLSSLGSFGYYSEPSSTLLSYGEQREHKQLASEAPLPLLPAHVPVNVPAPLRQQPLVDNLTGKISKLNLSDNSESTSLQKVKKDTSVPSKVFLVPEKNPAPISLSTPVVMPTDNRTKPTFQSMPAKPPTAPSIETKERNAWKCKFQERLKQTPDIFLEDYGELTRRNYRDKFYQLLCYEESEHITLLTEKCDGTYEFMFYGSEQQTQRGKYVLLGCIRGMNGDQVQYAIQASKGMYLIDPDFGTDICPAGLSDSNFDHSIDEDFKIKLSPRDATALDKANLKRVRGDWIRVGVEFEVKHSYFDTLHRAVISVPQAIIDKIIPVEVKALPKPNTASIAGLTAACEAERNLTVDGFDQLKALEAIISFPVTFPLILSGPFGSGKTRVLARSAYEFGIMGLRKKGKVRLLICAHHYKTVEVYRKYLTSAFNGVKRVKIIKIIREQNFYRKDEDFYQKDQSSNFHEKTLLEFKMDIEEGAYMNDRCIIVMATYMTSLNISDVLSSKMCAFTHVLLDEASQAREPEAVSSLCAAGRFTKVVITGDRKQVGPYVVVLGDHARKHGLQKSLLERMESLYLSSGLSEYILRLTINYRCHPLLTKLLSDTLYTDQPVSCGISVSQSLVHPLSPRSPCVFHCYNVTNRSSDSLCEWASDSSMRMEMEANALIGQLTQYFGNMPNERGWRDCRYGNICVISPNRNQLNLIKTKLYNTSFTRERRVSLLTSYNVQGHEFDAIFVSTLEHLDDDGIPSNPTKSLLTPRIFNTVLSRSKSLVVAIGNPYALIEIEKKMTHDEKCWSKYIQHCLEADSVTYGQEVTGVDKIDRELRNKVGASPATTRGKKGKPAAKEQYHEDSGSPWQTVQPRTKSPTAAASTSNKGWSYPGTGPQRSSWGTRNTSSTGQGSYSKPSTGYRSRYNQDGRQYSQDGWKVSTPTRSYQYHHGGQRQFVGQDEGYKPAEQLLIGDYIANAGLKQSQPSSKRRNRKKKK